MIDGQFGLPLSEKQARTDHGTGKECTNGGQLRVTIDILPDVALLTVFEFYVEGRKKKWHNLVHVCQKWRNLVFGSPCRLNLQLLCTPKTPVREMLDIWPPLPILVWVIRRIEHVDNVIAALEHNDRVSELAFISIPSSKFKKILAAMHQPFPALTSLSLLFDDETVPTDPGSFLGGSAPSLRLLCLKCIPFPGLTKLLISAIHLTHLSLCINSHRWPHPGYISPETMVSCLSALTRLESLDIKIESRRSLPDLEIRRLAPPTRTILPVLTVFRFNGISEYLEDLVARIDTPLLDNLSITFFPRVIFDTPELTQFISCTPRFKARDKARVDFSSSAVSVKIPQAFDGAVQLGISCEPQDGQLSSLAQVCTSSFPQAFIPAVEQLYIFDESFPELFPQDDIEIGQWLELLLPFTAVKNLYIPLKSVPRIAPVLQRLGERVTEVLPAMQTLFLEETLLGPVPEAIEQFLAARQLSGHPVTVSRLERKHFG